MVIESAIANSRTHAVVIPEVMMKIIRCKADSIAEETPSDQPHDRVTSRTKRRFHEWEKDEPEISGIISAFAPSVCSVRSLFQCSVSATLHVTCSVVVAVATKNLQRENKSRA
jgi:hypothetical protein